MYACFKWKMSGKETAKVGIAHTHTYTVVKEGSA